MLRLAALLGPTFRLQDVAALLQVTSGELLNAADEALATGIIANRGDRLAFRTPTMWQQVLDSVPSAVAHSLRADVERLLGSLSVAVSGSAVLYQLAPADLVGTGADVVRGIAMQAGPGAVESLALDAVQGEGDNKLAAGALGVVLAHVLVQRGRPREAAAIADRVARDPDTDQTVRDRARAVAVIARYLDEGVPPDSSSVDTAGSEPMVCGHAAALVLSESRWVAGDIDGAVRLARIGMSALTSTEATWLLVPWCTLADKLGALWCVGEAKRTVDWLDQTVARFDISAHAAYPAVQRARLLLRQGRLDEAAEQATAGLARAEGMGVALATPVALAVLASVAVRQGDTSTAARYVAACQAARQRTVTPPCPLPDWVELQLAMEQDGPQAVAELLYGPQAGLLWSPALFLDEPCAAAFFVRVGMAIGDNEIATSAVRLAGRLAENNPQYPVLAAAAAHAQGLYERNVMQLARAATRHPSPCAATWARLDLERLNAGQPPVASTDKPRPPLEPVADHERRPTGWATLSPRETAVARLAAEGLTNQQIGRRLRLSPHTVNYHLRRIFQKLNLRSRVELARLSGHVDETLRGAAAG
jgi:DNA-binding CsgD family transcriptional regulator